MSWSGTLFQSFHRSPLFVLKASLCVQVCYNNKIQLITVFIWKAGSLKTSKWSQKNAKTADFSNLGTGVCYKMILNEQYFICDIIFSVRLPWKLSFCLKWLQNLKLDTLPKLLLLPNQLPLLYVTLLLLFFNFSESLRLFTAQFRKPGSKNSKMT